jgi:hypothetical protein
MKNLKGLAISGVSLLLVGCLSAPETGIVPDGDEAGMTIINDKASLNGRFTRRNETILLENAAGALTKAADYEKFTMTLIAEIDPPRLHGTELQATSVSLSGGYAYISYNTAGEAYGGGVDVVRVGSGYTPEIVSSAIYENADVHSLYYSNGDLYLAEASGEEAAASPAVLERMRVENGELQMKARERAPLNSFAATSVTVRDDRVFAISGNTGGLHALARENLAGGEPIAADDARWVDADDSRVVVVQGMPGRISVYDKGSMTLTGQWPFAGADIPESKSTVRILGGKALIAAGTGGVQLMDLATGRIVGSVGAPSVPGLGAGETVTNAADGAGDLIYVSNGAAGVYAIGVSGGVLEDPVGDKEIQLKPLGRLAFEGLESVNHIAFDGNLLVIVTGRGGVKIVSVEAVPSVSVRGVFDSDID